ncbi:hypothetical protein Acr_06g0002140 [Actinidia rufa]|uniref:Uncharacterized protein n=1 Tax=Actinidia rufa TaxID=165716 RepID=A0A7J0EP64_9ERIC|nr:hypothetical protein Acr_06g0002140 [Actinidia rufa]
MSWISTSRGHVSWMLMFLAMEKLGQQSSSVPTSCLLTVLGCHFTVLQCHASASDLLVARLGSGCRSVSPTLRHCLAGNCGYPIATVRSSRGARLTMRPYVHHDYLGKTRHSQRMLIEIPRPNMVATIVEGAKDCIPVRTWLIHKAGLRFPINPILKESSMPEDRFRYQSVHHQPLSPASEPPTASDKLGMMASSPSLGTMETFLICTEAIKTVNNCQRPGDMKILLWYEPAYRHIIPHRAEQLELDEGAAFARALALAGGTSTESSGDDSSSVDLSGSREEEEAVEVEEGDEVDQVGGVVVLALAAVVIISDKEVADHVFPPVLPDLGDEVNHSFVGGEGADSNSEIDMPSKAKNLGDALDVFHGWVTSEAWEMVRGVGKDGWDWVAMALEVEDRVVYPRV